MTRRHWRAWSAALALMAAGCGVENEDAGGEGTIEEPSPGTGEASTLLAPPTEIHHFEWLDEMIATSTAVVEGEIVSVEPGRTVGGEDGIQFEAATLLVHEVLSGDLSASTVVLEMEGWDTEGNRFVHPYELEPNRVGDRGIYFLWEKREPTPEVHYRLINTQGRYLDAAPGARALPIHREDPLTQELSAMSTSVLRSAILATPARAPVPGFVEIPTHVEMR